ncbi:tyrosine-protein kinase Btk29A isoform X5 [Oratosquilla oratoria]|uniref:tyrosine-protein kinase Btk29A isoform X5 n=1 Tax=Oratosquilla oratoria TaxID=337810 RepID=UPI003F7641A8
MTSPLVSRPPRSGAAPAGGQDPVSFSWRSSGASSPPQRRPSPSAEKESWNLRRSATIGQMRTTTTTTTKKKGKKFVAASSPSSSVLGTPPAPLSPPPPALSPPPQSGCQWQTTAGPQVRRRHVCRSQSLNLRRSPSGARRPTNVGVVFGAAANSGGPSTRHSSARLLALHQDSFRSAAMSPSQAVFFHDTNDYRHLLHHRPQGGLLTLAAHRHHQHPHTGVHSQHLTKSNSFVSSACWSSRDQSFPAGFRGPQEKSTPGTLTCSRKRRSFVRPDVCRTLLRDSVADASDRTSPLGVPPPAPLARSSSAVDATSFGVTEASGRVLGRRAQRQNTATYASNDHLVAPFPQTSSPRSWAEDPPPLPLPRHADADAVTHDELYAEVAPPDRRVIFPPPARLPRSRAKGHSSCCPWLGGGGGGGLATDMTCRPWRPNQDTGGGGEEGKRKGIVAHSWTSCMAARALLQLCKVTLKTATSSCMLCPEVDRSGRPRRYCYDQPSPSPPLNQDNMLPYQVPGVRTAFGPYRKKIVVAIYDYNPTEIGDLPLRKNEEYEVLQDAEENWWRMRNRNGEEGYAPSNYVKEKASLGLQQYDWYLGDATRQRAEFILKREEKEGCFVVRNSTTTTGMYTLSVYSKQPTPQVKHYHIKREGDLYYLSQSIKCRTIPDLIFKHKYNPGGLCTRLRSPPTHGRQPPTTAGISHDKWEIDPNELNLLEELGSGQFGVVRHGKLKCMDVAVKMMKEGTMSEEAFIEEAKVMTQLQHTNLVQLYGVCSRHRPIYIVTEYLRYGSLLLYLRQKEKHLITCSEQLLDMCLQVCEGMAYLEKQRFIHRDLAARNCLVGSQGVIKVGDFGLARYVVDDEYAGSGGAKFPIKWAAPEVLNYMRFSSKSDVWAFGVLMWEVFTCGRMPYGKLRNAEVVDRVQSGQVLERPTYCPETVYELMKLCWTHDVDRRPSFADMRCQIVEIQEA